MPKPILEGADATAVLVCNADDRRDDEAGDSGKVLTLARPKATIQRAPSATAAFTV
jgi:hypothetical protein